jgi:hypothetical protein
MAMMNRTSVAVGLASLVAAVSITTGAVSAQQSIDFSMTAQNGSGHSGTATLYAEGDKTRVVVLLDNPVPGPEPAHIHLGSCPVPDATPLHPLSSVENGKSETVLDMNMGALLVDAMAINVHQSPQELAVYVSCGDIVMDDDFTKETTIDSVRENAREGTSDELLKKQQKERFRE